MGCRKSKLIYRNYCKTWSKEILSTGFDLVNYFHYGTDKVGNIQIELSSFDLNTCLRLKQAIQELIGGGDITIRYGCDKLVGFLKSRKTELVTDEKTLRDALSLSEESHFYYLLKISKENLKERLEKFQRSLKRNKILLVTFAFSTAFYSRKTFMLGYLLPPGDDKYRNLLFDPIIVYERLFNKNKY